MQKEVNVCIYQILGFYCENKGKLITAFALCRDTYRDVVCVCVCGWEEKRPKDHNKTG